MKRVLIGLETSGRACAGARGRQISLEAFSQLEPGGFLRACETMTNRDTSSCSPMREAELVKSKAGWLRSVRFHLREQMKREGVPLLRMTAGAGRETRRPRPAFLVLRARVK